MADDNIGSVSVDVKLEHSEFDDELSQLKTDLDALANTPVSLKIEVPKITANQVELWQKFAKAAVQIQNAPISGGPGASPAPAQKGAGAAMAKMAFTEAEATSIGEKIAAAVERSLQNLTIDIQIGNLQEIKDQLGGDIQLRVSNLSEIKQHLVEEQGGGGAGPALIQLRTALEKRGGAELRLATEGINQKLKAAGKETIPILEDIGEQAVAFLRHLRVQTFQEVAQVKTPARSLPTITGGVVSPYAGNDPDFAVRMAALTKTTKTLNTLAAQAMAAPAGGGTTRVQVTMPAAAATPIAEAAAPALQVVQQAIDDAVEQAAKQESVDAGRTYLTDAAVPARKIEDFIDDAYRKHQGISPLGGRRTTARELGAEERVRRSRRDPQTQRFRRRDYVQPGTDALLRPRPTEDPLLARDYQVLGGRNPRLLGSVVEQGIDLTPIARELIRGAFANQAVSTTDKTDIVPIPVRRDTMKPIRSGRAAFDLPGREGTFTAINELDLVRQALIKKGVDRERALLATGPQGIFAALSRERKRGMLFNPLANQAGFGGGTAVVERPARDLVRGMAALRMREKNLATAEANLSDVTSRGVIGEPIAGSKRRRSTTGFTSAELRQEAIDQAKVARQEAYERLQSQQSKMRNMELRYIAQGVGGELNRQRVAETAGENQEGMKPGERTGLPLRPEDRVAIAKAQRAGRMAREMGRPELADPAKMLNDIFTEMLEGKLPLNKAGEYFPKEELEAAWAAGTLPRGSVPVVQAMPDETGKLAQRFLTQEEWHEQVKKNPQFTARAALQQRFAGEIEQLYNAAGLHGRERKLGKLTDLGFEFIEPGVKAVFGHQRNYEYFADMMRNSARQDTRRAGLTSTPAGTRQNPRNRVLSDRDVMTQGASLEMFAERDRLLKERDDLEKQYGFRRRQLGITPNKGSVAGTYPHVERPRISDSGELVTGTSDTPLRTGIFMSAEELEEGSKKVAAAQHAVAEIDKKIKAAERTFRRTGEQQPMTTGDEERKAGAKSGMQPAGGVPLTLAERLKLDTEPGQPVSAQQARELREQVLAETTAANPAFSGVAGGGVPPSPGGPQGPMGPGEGQVHVWIDNPFPLSVAVEGMGGGSGLPDAADRARSANRNMRLDMVSASGPKGDRPPGTAYAWAQKLAEVGATRKEAQEHIKQWYGAGAAREALRNAGRGMFAEDWGPFPGEGTPGGSGGGGGGAASGGFGGPLERPREFTEAAVPMRYRRTNRSMQEVAAWIAGLAPENQLTVRGGLRYAPREVPVAARFRQEQGFFAGRAPNASPEAVALTEAMKASMGIGPDEAFPGLQLFGRPAPGSFARVPGRSQATAPAQRYQANVSYARAQGYARMLGLQLPNVVPPGVEANVANAEDVRAAAITADLRRKTGMLGQRAFGPTVTSAVMNLLAGNTLPESRFIDLPAGPTRPGGRSLGEIFGVAPGEQLQLPGDPLSRINLARREATEAARLTERAGKTAARAEIVAQQRQNVFAEIQAGRAQGLTNADLKPLRRSFFELSKESEQLVKQTKEQTKAAEESTDASQFLTKHAAGAGDVLRNLAQGFAGGIAAGLIAPLAPMIAGAAIGFVAGTVGEALKPAYEAAIGYQNVTNKVIGSLSDQVLANNGLVSSAVALKASQAGLAFSTYESIAPQLEQAATIEAGNKAYQDYIGLIRAGGQPGAVPRGLVQPTGGFNLLGIQTPIGATPSTMENFLNQFSGVYRTSQTGLGAMLSGTPDRSTDVIQNVLGMFGDLGAVIFGGETPESLVLKSEELKATRIEEINAQLDKMGHGFEVVHKSAVSAEEATASFEAMGTALKKLGYDDATIANIRALGLVFKDSAGILREPGDFAAALTDWTASFTKQSPEGWLRSATARGGALTAQIYGLEQQSQLARQGVLGQFALQRFAAPRVRLDEVLSGMTGVPEQFRQSSSGRAGPDLAGMFQAMGIGAIERSIGAIANPATQQEARQMLGFVQQAGAEIHALQVESQQIQMASAFRQMNRDLFVTNRQLSDVVGLTGRTSVQVEGGALVQASEIGVLERRNMLLGRSLQLLQFEHQQRSLNYQVAVAGFMAEGATGEERAARLEVAEREAQFQQTMLTGQQTLADNSWQIQQEQNTRAFEQAMHEANELVRRLDDTSAQQRIDEQIADAAEDLNGALGMVDTYIQLGNGMIGLAIAASQQMLLLGASVVEAEGLATQGLIDAYNSLHDILPETQVSPGWNDPGGPGGVQGPPSPPAARPGGRWVYQWPMGPWAWIPDAPSAGLPPGGIPPGGPGGGRGFQMGGPGPDTPFVPSGGGNIQVQIVNPSAGVDTQALTRVVISELNRQASLRGLNNVM